MSLTSILETEEKSPPLFQYPVLLIFGKVFNCPTPSPPPIIPNPLGTLEYYDFKNFKNYDLKYVTHSRGSIEREGSREVSFRRYQKVIPIKPNQTDPKAKKK